MESFTLHPIAYVRSEIKNSSDMPHGGVDAAIELLPAYAEALRGIEESSHIWVLCWFHQALRDALTARPGRHGQEAPEYGVFALRTMNRPNPIALTRTRLLGRDGNTLRVDGLDAIDGTPVLDIKPYFQSDTVFSPRTSYIKAPGREGRLDTMRRRAFNHHREECPGLWLALRMALVAEEALGHLHDDAVTVSVTGSPCLADATQVLATARVANPPRFSWQQDDGIQQTVWRRGPQIITLTARREFTLDELRTLTDREVLFMTQCP